MQLQQEIQRLSAGAADETRLQQQVRRLPTEFSNFLEWEQSTVAKQRCGLQDAKKALAEAEARAQRVVPLEKENADLKMRLEDLWRTCVARTQKVVPLKKENTDLKKQLEDLKKQLKEARKVKAEVPQLGLEARKVKAEVPQLEGKDADPKKPLEAVQLTTYFLNAEAERRSCFHNRFVFMAVFAQAGGERREWKAPNTLGGRALNVRIWHAPRYMQGKRTTLGPRATSL